MLLVATQPLPGHQLPQLVRVALLVHILQPLEPLPLVPAGTASQVHSHHVLGRLQLQIASTARLEPTLLLKRRLVPTVGAAPTRQQQRQAVPTAMQGHTRLPLPPLVLIVLLVLILPLPPPDAPIVRLAPIQHQQHQNALTAMQGPTRQPHPRSALTARLEPIPVLSRQSMELRLA